MKKLGSKKPQKPVPRPEVRGHSNNLILMKQLHEQQMHLICFFSFQAESISRSGVWPGYQTNFWCFHHGVDLPQHGDNDGRDRWAEWEEGRDPVLDQRGLHPHLYYRVYTQDNCTPSTLFLHRLEHLRLCGCHPLYSRCVWYKHAHSSCFLFPLWFSTLHFFMLQWWDVFSWLMLLMWGVWGERHVSICSITRIECPVLACNIQQHIFSFFS